MDLSEENLKQLKADAVKTDGNTLMRYIRVFSDLSRQLRYASQKRVLLEVALIRLTHPAMEPLELVAFRGSRQPAPILQAVCSSPLPVIRDRRLPEFQWVQRQKPFPFPKRSWRI